jgi:hypothetical protein
VNEEALAHWGLLRNIKKKTELKNNANPFPTFREKSIILFFEVESVQEELLGYFESITRKKLLAVNSYFK